MISRCCRRRRLAAAAAAAAAVLQMWDLTVSPPFHLGEQAEESRVGEATGGPGPAGSLCPLPKGDIGRVPVWSTVETLAKCYYPELAHLRDSGNGLLADYAFPKGACPGESAFAPPPQPSTSLCFLSSGKCALFWPRHADL